MKFRKKPVVIEAFEFTGMSSLDEMRKVWGDSFQCHPHGNGGLLKIKTLEGYIRPTVGDWIIRGIKGEYYPCKPDIFEATYERVPDGPLIPTMDLGEMA